MLDWIKHFYSATHWSFSGIYILFSEEQSARMELAGALAGLAWLIWRQCTLPELGLYVVLCMATFAIEALNTAIEGVIDHLSPHKTDFGRRAKDLGSAAVFFMLASTGLYWLALTISSFTR